MKNSSKKIILTGVILLIIISLPYIVAAKITGDSTQFGGFLLNPIDGNSYLAKMYEGYTGDWLFTLPYTPGHQNGVFLFEFYLFLGHVARWLSLSVITMFHLARIISTGIFFIVLLQFLRNTLKLPDNKVLLTTLLICFGSGIGWLFIIFGFLTSDFWVAEAYPFLSAFSNPHFILGMALFLLLLMMIESKTKKGLFILWLLGLIISIVMPFAGVMTGIIFFGREIWRWQQEKKIHMLPSVAIFTGAGICTIFQYWQTLKDPLLANWNSQNITLTPPIWNLIISFSPALIFAIVGIVKILKEKPVSLGNMVLLIWFFSTLILIVMPFALQRRFMFALYIPTAIFAVEGIFVITKSVEKKLNFLFFVIFLFSVVTNILVITLGFHQVKIENSEMLLENDEMDAFLWIGTNTEEDDIILSSPSLGNFLPAYTGRQVLYGHPFETVNAEIASEEINKFYLNESNPREQEEFLSDNQVDWIILGPRERKIGVPDILGHLEKIYQNNSVTIFEVNEEQ